ncbi:hypothetical protein ACIRQP_40535 [Streptomyces sp. NPDC102274]|uniref:hypothetical protein n=1 Tax=Streptomyces sp. NPDC102274 TaxID=3366151 RepID=UPI003814D946
MITDASASTTVDVLADAVARSGVIGRVETPQGTPCVALVLLGNKRLLPFELNRTAAAAWLAEAGIDASTGDDGSGNVVITLRRSAAVHLLIERLLAPCIRSSDIADRLLDAFGLYGLRADVTVADPDTLVIEIRDADSPATAVSLGALLGADDVARGLDFSCETGLDELAGRMRWLLTDVTSGRVGTEARPGGAHARDELEVRLSPDQALRLAERITAGVAL